MVLSLCLSVFVCAESNEPTVVCSPPKKQRSMDDVDWLKSGLEQEKGRQEKFPQLEEIWESCPAQTTDGARFSRAHVITSCVSSSEDVSEADSIPLCATRGKKTGYTSHILGPFFLFWQKSTLCHHIHATKDMFRLSLEMTPDSQEFGGELENNPLYHVSHGHPILFSDNKFVELLSWTV